MRKDKRGSTLVMVICVFAFVMVIGVSVVLLAGVASQQVSRQFGRQQAEYAAQSVIDTVCAQLADGTIDPVSAPEKKLTGGGVDDILGTYRITVEPYEAAGYVNTFKVSVDVERSGQKSAIYSLMKYEAGGAQVELAGLFDLMAGATHKNAALADTPSTLGYANVFGSIFFDNGSYATKTDSGGGISKNLDVIGSLELNLGAYGTKTDDPAAHTHVQSNKAITLIQAEVSSDVRSEEDVTVSGEAAVVEGDVYANGNVTVADGATVTGDIHAGGNVIVTGRAKVNGNIYANGKVLDRENNVYENGNVSINDGAALKGDIYANGMFEASGEGTKADGSIYVNGEAKVKTAAALKGLLKSSGNIVVENRAAVQNVECRGDVVFEDDAIANGTVRANGTGTLKKANFYGTVSIVGKIDVTGSFFWGDSAFADRSVISETEINVNGLGKAAGEFSNRLNPAFYAPNITVGETELADCKFYAAGGEGTIRVNNCTGTRNEFYANGDITITDCSARGTWDGLQGLVVQAKGVLTFSNSRVTDPLNSDPVSLAADGGINATNSYIKGTLASKGEINLTGTGTQQTVIAVNSSLKSARKIVMTGRASLNDVSEVICAALELNKGASISAHTATISVFGTEAEIQGILSDTQASCLFNKLNVNGTVDMTSGNFTVNTEMTVKGGGSFNDVNIRGNVLLGIDPTISGGSVPYTVVDPATLPTVPAYGGENIARLPMKSVEPVGRVEPEYDEMPMVDLKLQDKYAVITEIKIPDLARAQIEKNSVMINFDASKDDPAILNGDEYTIQNNCSIELGTGRETWGKKIVLDASAGDLYVKLKPQSGTSAFTLPNGVSLLSKGEHNVYLFLDEETGTSGHTDFAMNTNCFVGRYEYYGKTIPDVGSDPLTPNLYLFSNAKGVSVSDLGQYNSSYAFIYVPYGTVELSGAAMDPYGAKLCGSAVGAVVNMGGSGQKYVQYAAKGSIGGGGVAGWTRTGTYYMQNEGGA